MIDLAPRELSEVLKILSNNLMAEAVWAFGSRVNGAAGRYSDLDLVVVGDTRLSEKRLDRLKGDFSDSNLPFLVDVLDWGGLSEDFQSIIKKSYEVLV